MTYDDISWDEAKPGLEVTPSGQYTPDGEPLYNVFYEGSCLAACVLENEIENVYYGYIMSEMQEDIFE